MCASEPSVESSLVRPSLLASCFASVGLRIAGYPFAREPSQRTPRVLGCNTPSRNLRRREAFLKMRVQWSSCVVSRVNERLYFVAVALARRPVRIDRGELRGLADKNGAGLRFLGPATQQPHLAGQKYA